MRKRKPIAERQLEFADSIYGWKEIRLVEQMDPREENTTDAESLRGVDGKRSSGIPGPAGDPTDGDPG